MTLTHLQRLEAESIHIMREVVAEAENPVILYSVGKDSAVMLHLAMKAFYPAKPPFPMLHVDTTWKFQEMYAFRDMMAEKLGFDLLVHINPEGLEKNINPFTHGSAIHTDVMKTEGLKQALARGQYYAAFGAFLLNTVEFLTTVWRSGALMGRTPEEAFFVKCDEETMTQDDIDNGRLIMLIGVAPVKPAEFVIIRIGQWSAGSSVEEF